MTHSSISRHEAHRMLRQSLVVLAVMMSALVLLSAWPLIVERVNARDRGNWTESKDAYSLPQDVKGLGPSRAGVERRQG